MKWLQENSGSGNRTSTQCLQNRTEQLVVNGIFKCVSELVLPDLAIKKSTSPAYFINFLLNCIIISRVQITSPKTLNKHYL